MDWPTLKKKVYYEDGSFRDIVVKDTTIKDWQVWADFVNNNYKIKIDDHNNVVDDAQIDIDKVNDFWKDLESERFFATIFVGNALVNVHFFDDCEIENDILPSEIKTLEDHEQIMAYMTSISSILGKKVLLTAEGDRDEPLIIIDEKTVTIA